MAKICNGDQTAPDVPTTLSDLMPQTPLTGHVPVWNGSAWVPGTGQSFSTYNVRYSTDFNYVLTYDAGWGALSAGVPVTLTLALPPKGINTSYLTNGVTYSVYISGTGTAEAVRITGGNAAFGTPNGTITFTPRFSHATGYTISSATAGIQEAINDAGGNKSATPSSPFLNQSAVIVVPPSGPPTLAPPSASSGYNIYDTICMTLSNSLISGYGAAINHYGRGPAFQVGDLNNANHYNNATIAGVSIRSVQLYNPVRVVSTSITSNAATITTDSPHGFIVGDLICIKYTDTTTYWGEWIVTSVPDTSSFTFSITRADLALQTTPGLVALSYCMFLTNANGTHFKDIQTAYAYESGAFHNYFSIWDDENCVIEHFNNNANGMRGGPNWFGHVVFSPGNKPGQNIAPVITFRESNITNGGGGFFIPCSNNVYVQNSVMQNVVQQIYSSNLKGNFGGFSISNLYSETAASANPNSPVNTPWPGCGVTGLLVGISNVGAFSQKGPAFSGTPLFAGAGAITYVYFVVARNVTAGVVTEPMLAYVQKSTGSDSYTVVWPRVVSQTPTDTITYDLIRVVAPNGTPYAAGGNFVAPFGTLPGGSAAASGVVATSIAQPSGFIATFNDTGNALTSSYVVGAGGFAPVIVFWPGQFVTTSSTLITDIESTSCVSVGIGMNPAQIVTAPLFGVSTSGYSAGFSAKPSGNSIQNQPAFILREGTQTGGGAGGKKGRIIIAASGQGSSTNATHIITLNDSNPAKTLATSGYRAAFDATDAWIGTDPSGGTNFNNLPLAFGGPTSVSAYVGANPDGASWKERLTGSLKTFAVPVQFPTVLFASLPASPSGTMLFCSDAKSVTDGAVFDSVAVGGGTGTLLLRANNTWRVR